MNEFESQWRSLSSAGHSGGRLRVYPDHLLDFFIDYSLSGDREVIIEARGINLEFHDLPVFENLKVAFKSIPNGIRIGMTLTDEQLIKSFSVMCFDIAERSIKGTTVESAAVIAIECLRDWAALLKRRGKSGLSRNEAMGLWGELRTIEALITALPSKTPQIITGWGGPDGDQRDIGFNSNPIEVKTQISTKSISLKISSLEQLDEQDKNLQVVLNRISPSDRGLSVVDLVDEISRLIVSNPAIHSEFERRLELARYDSNLETCLEKFGLDERFIYEVRDNFPKLTLGNVPLGIKSAEYEITGAAINSFQMNWSDLLEKISDQP